MSKSKPPSRRAANSPEHQEEQRELKRLGQTVRELREQGDMSTRELAAATGYTPRRINRIEAGEAQLRFDVIVALKEGTRRRARRLVRFGRQAMTHDSEIARPRGRPTAQSCVFARPERTLEHRPRACASLGDQARSSNALIKLAQFALVRSAPRGSCPTLLRGRDRTRGVELARSPLGARGRGPTIQHDLTGAAIPPIQSAPRTPIH
jgi:transcriptional regulator with XRE-family HTH domain